jgi:hypothetical protein
MAIKVEKIILIINSCLTFLKSKLCSPYNNLSGGCRLVQQVVKWSIYYNDLSGGCGLV